MVINFITENCLITQTNRKEPSALNFLLTRPEKNLNVTLDGWNQLSYISHRWKEMGSANHSVFLCFQPLKKQLQNRDQSNKTDTCLPSLDAKKTSRVSPRRMEWRHQLQRQKSKLFFGKKNLGLFPTAEVLKCWPLDGPHRQLLESSWSSVWIPAIYVWRHPGEGHEP